VINSALVFSDYLSTDELKNVNYHSYYPVLEQKHGDIILVRTLYSDNSTPYTIKFDYSTRAIQEGERNWFNESLLEKIDLSRLLPSDKISRIDFSKKRHKKCIVLNLLDYCYGHSLVKLLNVESFYNEYKDTHDLFLISFPDIEDYVPKDRFNGCLLNVTFGEIKKIYSLQAIIDKVREQYEEVDFGVLDAYLRIKDKESKASFYDFYGSKENNYKDKKLVTFHYRADNGRAWGEKRQKHNVTTLLTEMREYFSNDVVFSVIGDKDKNTFPDWVLDKRIERYPNPIVHEYSQIIASSVIMISVTGSNLVLPSLLSKGMIVHFVKEPLMRLTGTDVVNYRGYVNETTYEHVYIFEKGTRSTHPTELAQRLIRMYEGKLAIEFKGYSMDCIRNKRPVPTQKDYILRSHSYFNYIKAKELNNQINQSYWQAINRRYIIKRIFNKIKKIILKES
jgi:hypothetical protein